MTTSNAFELPGPNVVHALEHPTRFTPSLVTISASDPSFVSSQSEFELVPAATRESRVASGLTTPRLGEQSTDGGQDGHERSGVHMSRSVDDCTPARARNISGTGSRTREDRDANFRSVRVRSVTFDKDLVPRYPRGEWSRQNSIAELASNQSNASDPLDQSVSSRSLDVSSRTKARYSVFPKDVSLDERRMYEQELIQRFDRLEINQHVGDFWFIIDSIWMNRWVNFVLGKGDPPGHITNYNLFEKDGSPFQRERGGEREGVSREWQGPPLVLDPASCVRAWWHAHSVLPRDVGAIRDMPRLSLEGVHALIRRPRTVASVSSAALALVD